MPDTTGFTIDSVYPWGRNLDEYRRMFALSDADLASAIAGCADGPASFNAEMHMLGRRVVSFDPLYQFTADEIRHRIELTYPRLVEWTRQNLHIFSLDAIRSPGELGRRRLAAMEQFLADYDAARSDGRCIVAGLPHLTAADRQFDLALCSHFLFLYDEQFSLQFHVDSLLEMMRVATEARVFPLLSFDGRPSCHVESAIAALAERGMRATVERVPYEVQRGGNQMLRITRGDGTHV